MKNIVVLFTLIGLTTPAIACSATHTQGTITLTVGSSGCGNDPKNLNNLAVNLKRAIVQNEARDPLNQSQSASSIRAEKLKKFSDLRHQARHLSTPAGPAPTYYGQR